MNAFSEGSNKPLHETKRQRKDYLHVVNHVCKGKHFRTLWSYVPITFTRADLKLKHFPHNDPLVIRANIGKNTLHFFINDVGRILVDTDSSADIITSQCFILMGFTEKDLKKAVYPLIGFAGKRIEAVGKAEINVTFSQGLTMRTKTITFDIVDINYPYNTIFRRNIINKFAAAIHQQFYA